MIATLFTSLNTSPEQTKLPTSANHVQPVLFVMQKTMPIFKAIGETFINDGTVIEALCTALRHAVTNLQNDFLPMLPDLCCVIVAILQSKCVPPLVDLAKSVSARIARMPRITF